MARLSARFREALVFAAQLHAGQTRKGTDDIPYVGHLLGVASIALDFGANEDEAIGALLHDALEDQGGDNPRELEERICDLFGPAVLSIVIGCTDTQEHPKPPWQPRKQAYLDRVRKEKNRSVLLVSAADKLHNATAILRDYRLVGESLWSRFRAGRDGQLWYHVELVRAFREAGGSESLVAELERVVSQIHEEIQNGESEKP